MKVSDADRVALSGAVLGSGKRGVLLQVSGCMALSPALFDNKLLDGLMTKKAISQLTVPTLLAGAPDDGSSAIGDVKTLLRRAPKNVVTLVQLPAGAGHGWDTVNEPADPNLRSPFSDTLVDFLTQRLR